MFLLGQFFCKVFNAFYPYHRSNCLKDQAAIDKQNVLISQKVDKKQDFNPLGDSHMILGLEFILLFNHFGHEITK